MNNVVLSPKMEDKGQNNYLLKLFAQYRAKINFLMFFPYKAFSYGVYLFLVIFLFLLRDYHSELNMCVQQTI